MTRSWNIGRFSALGALMVVAFGGQAVASPYTDIIQTDPGLVSYWNFEDPVVADGTIAADFTFANPGTYTGFLAPAAGVPLLQPGGQAVSLYGAGRVEIPNEANFDFTGSFSLEAWVQVDTFSTDWQAIVTKGDNSWRIHRSGGSNNVAFGTSGVGGVAAVDVTNGNVDINNGNWHHIVASFDTTASQRTLYVDGNAVTEAFTGTLDLSDDAVMIGGNADFSPAFRQWNGLIDDVSIYNRALTAADVANRLALAGGGNQPGSPIPPPGTPELDPEPNTPVTPDYNWYAFQDPNTGTWNAYEIRGLGDRYGGTLSMYNSLLEARTREFNGIQGDLASVGSQAENDFLYRVVNNENAWIGLTDDPNFGTSEGNYVWTNGDTSPFRNWGGGEPNDAGGGEDATHIRASDGAWNDNQSGIPGSGQSGSPSYVYAIEYQTNSATLQDLQAMGLFSAPSPILAGTPSSAQFDIREVDPAGQLNSVADARNLLVSGTGTITDYTADAVNFLDGGGSGNFGADVPFQNSGDDYALLARRRISISDAGDYTFGFNTDDGGELILRDTSGNIVPFELHAGRAGAVVSTYGSLVFDGIAPPGDSLGRVNLAAGDYDLELVFFERAGGAEVELFMGQGDFTGFDSSMFLIGLEPPPPPEAVVQFLDNGSGQFNAYQTITAGATWDEARVDSAARTFMGQTGHLATIQNQAENDSVDAAAPAEAWIGLTDSDQTSTIDGATMPGTEGNFVWINGQPVTYTNWYGGEPNNAGTGEDAAHMRADGMWNDHNAGSSLGQSDQLYPYVVEFDTNLAVPANQLPAWRVEDIRGTATTPDNANFVDLARNPDGSPTIVEGLFNVINFGDGGAEDQYGDGAPFLQGGGDNFLMRATTYVKVPEDGLYTFNGAHDDPINVVIGTKFGDVEITDTSCCGSNPATVFLTEGVYPIELTWAEFGGGEHVELGVGLGALANLDPAFALLGAENHPGGLMINLDPDLLGGLTPIPPQAPRGWNVLVQNASQSPGFDATPPGNADNLVDNIGEAEQLLAAGGPPEATDTPNTINYPDNGFPAGTDEDDFALEATGYIDVIDSSGTESLFFYANSDDGFRLEVDGVTVAEFLDPTGGSNTISGEVTVSDDDFIRLIMFERAGGEFVNLSRDMDGDIGTTGDRFLLGDPLSGIIIRQEPGGAGALIPEPASYLLLALGGLGLLVWRRTTRG